MGRAAGAAVRAGAARRARLSATRIIRSLFLPSSRGVTTGGGGGKKICHAARSLRVKVVSGDAGALGGGGASRSGCFKRLTCGARPAQPRRWWQAASGAGSHARSRHVRAQSLVRHSRALHQNQAGRREGTLLAAWACTFCRANVTMSYVSDSVGAAAKHRPRSVLPDTRLLAGAAERPCMGMPTVQIRLLGCLRLANAAPTAQLTPAAYAPVPPAQAHLQAGAGAPDSALQADVMHLARRVSSPQLVRLRLRAARAALPQQAAALRLSAMQRNYRGVHWGRTTQARSIVQRVHTLLPDSSCCPPLFEPPPAPRRRRVRL